ncbi:hypothetical protein CDD80_4962 [Ophiocordyceps camponoti-rufipedis]|uniref:Uncharacterized protein n=1 Tax=Ophiocordyceps camponoti-rufipedis TaxID=2004952 RepID=A0A2C5YY44_9HYPO|nr:hypothetical protein CDD80_4962 [Ophiocordyceps camponoti-rufipedis]
MEPSTTERVPWDRLRAWIDWHADDEGRAPPLTKAELEAISRLVPFGQSEPDVSGEDFVSSLLHLIQARRLPSPTFVDGTVFVPVEGNLMSRFRCVCSVEGFGSFPCLGLGVEDGWEAPTFQNKKVRLGDL